MLTPHYVVLTEPYCALSFLNLRESKVSILQNILIVLVVLVALSSIESSHAESQSFTVAARSYEQHEVFLREDDEIRFSINVRGGVNDDINFELYGPDQSKLVTGMVVEEYSYEFMAPSSGNYVFVFDNTISLISNKSVNFSYDVSKNTYLVYVDPLPSWADYASNVVYDATTYWKKVNPKLKFYVAKTPQEADFTVNWVRDFGQKHVGYAYGSKFIEVGLGDSNCLSQWNPYSSNHVATIMEHEIGHVLGYEHNDDPNDIMYPYTQNTEYGVVELDFLLKENQIKFISMCTGKDITNFDYLVKTNSKNGLNVFIVPSQKELENLSQNNFLHHYENNDCYGIEYVSYGGTCKGARQGSGIVIMAFDTSESIDVTIQYQENTSFLTPFESKTVRYERPILMTEEAMEQNSPMQESDDLISIITDRICGKGTILKDDQCVALDSIENGGGCLIATAAYGTELAPQVQQLRELRDNLILKTEYGSSFMTWFNEFYYSFSPTVADWERQSPVFKEIVKISIIPMVSSFSILNYVSVDSERDIIGYGMGVILLNLGLYFVMPTVIILKLRSKFKVIFRLPFTSFNPEKDPRILLDPVQFQLPTLNVGEYS